MQKKLVTKELLAEAQKYVKERIVTALNESPSHFHAVHYTKEQLKSAGFHEVSEVDRWNLKGGEGYYFTRNESTIVAFVVGKKVPENGIDLFKIVGCHTDSPVLKLAPVSKKPNQYGFDMVNIMTYGGGLWRTWFDRDLTLAGKIVVKDDAGRLTTRLWHSKESLLKVSSLCIHLDRQEEFKPNKEDHTRPFLQTAIIDQLMGGERDKIDEDIFKVEEKHYRSLLDRISGDLNIQTQQIVDFELNICDQQPVQLMGIHNEFLSAPRLDNLASSFVSLDALIAHKNDDAQIDNSDISMLMLFDHEEIGSKSAQGADSNLLAESTHRLFHILKQKDQTEEDYYRSIHKSLMVSADMAHAIHPNYPGKHQTSHSPQINYGIVIKTNANQRYMTDSIGSSILRLTSERQNVPIQDFIVKNDSLCGSTIGPMMASKCGMKTIDIGAPQLGMHSIRETCGAIDLLYYRKLFSGFWQDYHELSYDLLRK